MYGYPGALTETTGIIAPIQECLLESWDGTLKVFPVTPHEWGDVSFEKLRAEGAYLVSATRTSGKITHVKINSECGGDLCLSDPFSGVECKIEGAQLSLRDNCWVGHLLPGQTVEMTLK
jgi:alpha-L-fucosidase 2